MSLSGLDDAKVKEAHDAAVAEPGGWFLLKYISRDEIELLGRGNGGIVEIRNAIAQFEEVSPLFGFLRYRRRNVVIKYVPEDCSRLVQARATVHFNAVTERFSPHDTVFPITTSKELRDTTLSAACSLHTASGSTSSSTSSLRRRRLMEIAEDEEEDNRAKRQSTVPEERPSTAKTASVTGQSAPPTSPPPALPTAVTPSSTYQSMVSEAQSSTDTRSSEIRSRSPTRNSIDKPRKSSQSQRPDLYSYSSYGSNGKPKVKLGPRPSLDVGGRPHTTSGATSHFRPVSTLPAGLKIFSRSSKTPKERPRSQYPPEPPSMTISPPSMPENPQSLQVTPTPARPHTSGRRPNTSSGASIKPLLSSNANTPKLPTITPEKARLMKAMELRKKQKKLSESPTPAPAAEPLSPTVSEGLKSPTVESNRISATPKEVHDTLAMLNDMTKEDDSGIAFDASSTLRTDESDATRSDSYPVSPVGPSERAESTRASSISESTDETVQEVQSSKATLLHEVPSVEGSTVGAPQDREGLGKASLSEQPLAVDHAIKEPAFEEPVAEEAPAEELQLLLPVTYERPPSPMSVPQIYRAATPEPEMPVEMYPTANGPVSPLLDEFAGPETDVEDHIKPMEKETTLKSETIPIPIPDVVPQPPSPVKGWKVPRSKFSVQDLKAAAAEPHVPKEPLPVSSTTATLGAPLPSPVGSSFSIDTKRSITEDEREKSPKRMRRRAMVEPIKTDIDLTDMSAANSDAHFSSDDDLMDELQSAVIQDAQPISVSKSPLSPVFPSPKKKGNGNRFSRAFSSPIRKDPSPAQHLSPPTKVDTARSISAGAAYLNRISQQPSQQPIAKKVNLGSGISQRIKALEKLQSLAPGASATPGSTAPPPGTSPAFFSVRKATARGSRSPSIADRANSLNRQTPSPTASPASSPENFKLRGRSGSIQDRLSVFNASPVPTTQPQKSRPESISVTARIIRDPNQPFPAMPDLAKDPSEYTPLDLKQSPLVIDHKKAVSTPSKETIQERRLSSSSKASKTTTTTRERRSSITIVKDLINQGRNSLSERRRSINLEASAPSPSALATLSPSRPPSTHTNGSPGIHRALSISSRSNSSVTVNVLSPPPTARSTSSASDEKEKKSGRASRMLRRMSSSMSSGRKNIAHAMSPTVREDPEPYPSPSFHSSHPSLSSSNAATTSVNIGDVNVQFPDTLLWKRRSMIVDSQGYLIVSPALTAHGNDRDKANAGAIRRYHLSSFRTPSIPDVEMQELPNSVVLDFLEGGGLQVACEDRGGQGRVLNILQDAHRNYAAYGQ